MSAKSVYNANYDTILPAGSFTSTAIDPWYGVVRPVSAEGGHDCHRLQLTPT